MPKARTVAEYIARQEAARELEHFGRAVVETWISATFEPGSVMTVFKEYPGLPGAAELRDDNGHKLLVWYDVFSDCVRWR